MTQGQATIRWRLTAATGPTGSITNYDTEAEASAAWADARKNPAVYRAKMHTVVEVETASYFKSRRNRK